MFTSIRNAWGAIGVVLFLIALFLVLDNSNGANTLLRSSVSGADKFARTLQGR